MHLHLHVYHFVTNSIFVILNPFAESASILIKKYSKLFMVVFLLKQFPMLCSNCIEVVLLFKIMCIVIKRQTDYQILIHFV